MTRGDEPMTEDTLNDTERERSWRITLAERAWGWHEADDERTAGYGHHMSQMLYRLPRDGQTYDMRVSIEQMLDDLRALDRDRDALAAKIADEEADEIDRWMGEHMYRHSISNNINGMGCDVGCRTRALQTAVNRMLTARRAALAGPEDTVECGDYPAPCNHDPAHTRPGDTARDTQRDDEGSGR